jgi:predicted metalloendopeptidase
MCGRFMSSHTNENRAFSYGWRRIRARIRLLLSTPPADQKKRAAAADVLGPAPAMYQACLGRGSPASQRESRIEFHHLVEHVVTPIRSHADLPTALGRLARMGYTGPFALSMERHPLEPRILPFWSPDGFPQAILDEGRIFQLLQAWRAVTEYTSMQEARIIEGTLRVSRALAAHRAERVPGSNVTDYADYVSRVFPGDLVQFGDWAPPPPAPREEWSWERYFQALDGNGLRFEPTTTMWAPDAQYMRWFVAQDGWRSLSVPDWRAWIEFSILYNGNDFDPELPDNVYFRQHDVLGPVGPGARFYHRLPRKHQRGTAEENQHRCLSLTEHMLPGWVASTYLERWMPERVAVQSRVRAMVEKLLRALQARVLKTSWLSEEDRQRLADKVGAIMVRVIEPEEWHPEPFGPSLSADRHDHNMNLVRRYRVQRNLALWHKDSGATWWSRSAIAFFAMPLTEVNAYYSGPSNSITILAGVLQSPFFNLQYGDVSQWAILGSIIGHELSHSLDHHGLHWDRDGNFHPAGILSAEGMRRFYTEIECVVREYGPAPAGCEDANAHYGNSTIGEDLADLVGISLSYDTLFDQNHPANVGDKQHFFMVLAQAFCETYDQEHRCAAVANDVHAVAEFRIDRTFRNMHGWHDVFGCHDEVGPDAGMCQVY